MSPPTSFRSLCASSNCASISFFIGIRPVLSSGNRFYGLLSSTFSSLSASAAPENLVFSLRKQCPSIKVQAIGGETEQPKWWEKKAGPNMIDINSTEQFLTALKDAGEGDRLVIVDFYGTWCGCCRAMFPKLCKTAEEHPEILFLKVNFDENKSLCKSLNVKVLPYFHIYRGADGQVESFSFSLAKFQKLRDAIERHSVGSSSLATEKVEDSSL